jgi:outer membrane receptor protein involved in Fe transport
LGITWRDYDRSIFDVVALTANVSRIERLPSETERYAFWSNPAIHRFIIGADNAGIPLEVERSNALELGLEAHRGDWSGRVNFYHYDFKDFIFLQDIKGIGKFVSICGQRCSVITAEKPELTWRVYEDSG